MKLSYESGKGYFYDNRMIEYWNGCHKGEWVPDQPYVTRWRAGLDLFAAIEAHYNCRRPMARLGGISPAQFEANVAELRH